MKNEFTNIQKDNLRKSNQESKSLTRQYIRTALLLLIKEMPIEKITVTAIINRAGVSRAGFYRNYSCKEDVIKDISSYICQQLSTYHIQETISTSTYERALYLFQRLKKDAEWFHLITLLGSQNTYLFNMTDYLDAIMSDQTTEQHYYYIAIAYSQKAIVLDWFQNGMKESPEEMAHIFSNIYRDIETHLPN